MEPAASSTEVDYSKMKLTELRAELESKGLDSKGKKAELVERLEDALKGGTIVGRLHLVCFAWAGRRGNKRCQVALECQRP